jgi:type I restriction enzyme S subunit
VKLPIKIPNEWAIVPLAEVLELHQSGIWGDPCKGNDGIPVLRSSNIQEGTLFLENFALRSIPKKDIDKYRLRSGDILITKSSGSAHLIGKCCIFKQPADQRPFLFSNFTHRIRSDAAKLDSNFLFFYLNSPLGKSILSRINNTTSGLRNLNMKDYLVQPIPLPPLPLQKEIAAVLEKADQVCSKRQESLRLTDQFLQSAFLDMFGNPVTNPKGWTVKKLGQSIKLKSGEFLPAKNMITDGQYAVYGGNGISGYHSSYLFEEPKIVIGRVGMNCGSVLISKPQSWITDNALYVSKKVDTFDDVFLAFMLRQLKLNRLANRAAQPLITGQLLKSLNLILPPISEQQNFAALVKRFDGIREKQHQSEHELEILFQSLMQKAFKGEL